MDETENADPRVGSQVQARYRILSRIADGSMGVVYRAERLQLGRHVAIKFLHASYAADAQFIQRFERETRVMSKLSHPHCVSVIDFGVEGAPYVVMEYVSGRTLRALLEDGPVTVARALHITKQILGGLAHAHAQDIVHRDIKPANIMLTEATGTGDHVRILDFGLATLRGAVSSDLSQSQIVVGTPNYMSPEQSMAIKVDGRSDLYSTGVVLFELLTGQKPFAADDTFELLTLHRTAPVPKLTEVVPEGDFPPGLQSVLERALAKQPEDRYESAIEMAQALDEATRPRAAAAPAASTAPSDASVIAYAPTEHLAVTRERSRGGLGFFGTLLALALLAGGAYAGWRYWQDYRASAEPAAASSRIAVPSAAKPPPTPAATTEAAPAPAAAVMTFDASVVALDAGAPAGDGGAELAAAALDGGAADDEMADEPPLPAEEQDEPVEPVAEEEAEADVAEPTTAEAATVAAPEPEPEPVPVPTPAAPVPAAKPNPVDTVSEAAALIRAGKREQAIRALLALKKKNPRSAYIPYLLGNLYFSKRWWTVGMDYYWAAISKNRLYRGKSILNKNVVRALGDRRTSYKASRLFTKKIGRAGLPYLRRAARSDRNPKVRRAAAYLVKRLSRRRR